jgi:hypothetical protein
MSRTNKGLGWMKTGKHSMKKSYQKESKKKFRRQTKRIGDPEAYLHPVCFKDIYWTHYW